MKHKIIKLTVALFLGIGLTGLQAQESLNASGGNTSGNGGSVSYSVGQVVYTSMSGLNGSVAQGVQQAYEISVVTGLEEMKNMKLKVLAYPNPTRDYLTLEVKDLGMSSWYLKLYDMKGRLLQTKRLLGSHTSIFMGKLAASTYFVKIIKDNKEAKIFKVIKK